MNSIESVVYTTDSYEITRLIKSDSALAYVISKLGNLSYSLNVRPFQFMVETVIGQMLSGKVADIITERMLSLCNGDIDPQIISELTIGELRNIGLSNAKSQYILGFSSFIKENVNYFDRFDCMTDKDVINEILNIRGFGIWSAKMYLIFVLNRLDVLPYEDGAFRQSYKWLYNATNMSNESIIEKCANWSPYSSLAARYLYRALDSGLINTCLPT